MVSDQEIASCVESLLRQSGVASAVNSPNVSGVVQQLEAKLGLDLSHKAGFIRDQINLFLPMPFKDNRVTGNQQSFLGVPQFPPSPFSHLPPQDELTFRSASSSAIQSHQLFAQHPPQPLAQSASMSKPDAHSASTTPTAAKEGPAVGTKRKGSSGGLSKVCGVSPLLQAIVGEPALPRTQIVKELWAYIRKNNLQDPNNKRKIICNDELRLVFETDSTDMFQMNKLLAKHIIPLEPSKEQKKKQKPEQPASVPEALVMVSDELAKFFDSGEREMLQSDALKRLWEYIDTYQLKDPLNPKMIRCDAKLQQLFGCESLSAPGVSEMLASHLFKQS